MYSTGGEVTSPPRNDTAPRTHVRPGPAGDEGEDPRGNFDAV